MANNSQQTGQLVAKVLSGSWRESAGALNFSANEIAAVTPLLYSTGSAALAWWRVHDRVSSPRVSEGFSRKLPSLTVGLLTPSAAIELLRDGYRHLRLAALVHEREIKHMLALLRAVDIEPVLVKGWAIARRYPDRALRPYGDIDLCVRPDQFAKAAGALKCLEAIEGHHFDLHAGFGNIGVAEYRRVSPLGVGADLRPVRQIGFGVRQTSVCRDQPKQMTRESPATNLSLSDNWDELFERSQLVSLGDEPGLPSQLRGEGSEERPARATPPLIPPHKWGGKPETALQVRVLCDEDHLRLLCLHLLRSGAWRPLWLCDVALLVESQGSEFDWDRCLGRDPLHADWVACTIGLAHQLLGAGSADVPSALSAQRELPRWLVPAVLRQWGRVRTGSGSDRVRGSSPTVREGLVTGLSDLYSRWNNPIRATAAVGGQFNNWPRLPYRLAESIMRSPELPKHLVRMVRHAGIRPASSLQPLVSESLS